MFSSHAPMQSASTNNGKLPSKKTQIMVPRSARIAKRDSATSGQNLILRHRLSEDASENANYPYDGEPNGNWLYTGAGNFVGFDIGNLQQVPLSHLAKE